jgi:hypothetical protein
MSTDTERAAFEAWMTEDTTIPLDLDAHGAYADLTAEIMWHAWQARAAIAQPAEPAKMTCDVLRFTVGAAPECVEINGVRYLPQADAQPVTGALLRRLSDEMEPFAAMSDEGQRASWWKHYAGKVRLALKAAPTARQPLNEERIVMDGLMMLPTADAKDCAKSFEAGVRFAERAHGITQEGEKP